MAKKPAVAPQVLEPESPDLALMETDGSAIQSFIRNITPFFKTAAALEAEAKAMLVKAQSLKAPTTMQEDVEIQGGIRVASAAKRKIVDHWDVRGLFGTVHKRMCAGMNRGVEACDDAAAIGQKLHNAYAEAARRKAAEEQDRIRLAAENKARADREAEAKRLDDEAVLLEEASADLSAREQTFILYYHSYGNAQHAASQAGFKDAFKAAARLMSLPKIQKAITAKQDAEAARTQAAARREQPLDVQVETVRPAVSKAAGAHDRTTHSAEVLNEAQFIAAVIAGGHGIPSDVLTVNTVKLGEYARSLQERINLWPGVRHVKTTRTI